MFARLRNFFYNHRRKFLFSGVFFGTLIILARYARSKLREWHEKEMNDLLERSRRRQHFENTERLCDQTALTVSKDVRNTVTSYLNCDKIIDELRSGSVDKISTWNNIKVLSVTCTATIIYTYTILVITLRIQLNILGGYMFKDLRNLTNSQAFEKIDDSTREKYLSLCGYFVKDGVQNIADIIKERVKEITSNYSLSDKLTVHDLQHIYWAITSTISVDSKLDPIKNASIYIISPNFMEKNKTDKSLVKLIDQTLDLLESQEVQDLMQTNLRCGFALLIDRISEFFNEHPKSDNAEYENGFIDLNTVTMPMAKIIPIFKGQVPENPTANDLPSDWLQRLVLSEELKALGANIYEAFSY